MYRIAKRFSFSASHRLFHLPPEHPCARLHGHNYEVEVELAGELTKNGFVVDYRELDTFKRFLDERLDHRHMVGVQETEAGAVTFLVVDDPGLLAGVEHAILSGQIADMHPATAENIARALFLIARKEWPDVSAVRVSETPKTWAEYTRP